MAALVERNRSGCGQEVDVVIDEAVFALMESTLADYDQAGVVRGRSGSVLPGVAPWNVYPAADGAEVLIAANADSVFVRLCDAMGVPELSSDERFCDHDARGRNMVALDECIVRWTGTLDADALLERHGIPAGRIYTAANMLTDPHFGARDMIVRLMSKHGVELPVAGVVPKFSRTPGSVRMPGPALGEHTREVLAELADVEDDEWAALQGAGVVRPAPVRKIIDRDPTETTR